MNQLLFWKFKMTNFPSNFPTFTRLITRFVQICDFVQFRTFLAKFGRFILHFKFFLVHFLPLKTKPARVNLIRFLPVQDQTLGIHV